MIKGEGKPRPHRSPRCMRTPSPGGPRGRIPEMPVRHSRETLRVLNLARSEASELGHDWVGCEHLMLGLLHEEGGEVGGELHRRGIFLGEVRAEVARLAGPRKERITTFRPFTPRARRVLEAAEREAALASSEQVEPMHLLRALAEEWDGAHVVALRNVYSRGPLITLAASSCGAVSAPLASMN